MISLEILKEIAHGIAVQFGSNCEVVVHDLSESSLNSSVVYIENGHVSNRKVGDGPSHVVLDALHNDNSKTEDHLGYLTRTKDGRILKSSTIYIRNDEGVPVYILAINYDITGFMMTENALKSFIGSEDSDADAEKITNNVNDLLDDLIERSVKKIGKPVAYMTKEEKTAAIQFLNDSGAFLITKSGDKVSKYFGISKYTLYSYIDVNK
ncbi:MAG: helix-turn-helix transcriptional regulator [Lachnospiraceae bacterium]|jgi:predicted transcriptional regulator YheO|nr:transcriptional regulator [Lachnospiraceae bacterium]MBP5653843.1 transcriptional regulator [Lachnospiraceae bacterium]MBQ3913541.1 transcriptional regulator [Lachnospiraceae bacterium]MCR5429067.1 helix-turn-helix transcriptional regulator [Lachnospiraceae bacterium]